MQLLKLLITFFGILTTILICFLQFSHKPKGFPYSSSNISLSQANTNMICTYELMVHYLYRCRVDSVIWKQPHESMIKNVNGIHLSGYSELKVTNFIVLKSIVKQFPHNLENCFPFLESIVIVDSQMEFIYRESLYNLTKLKQLNLRENKLTVIGYQLFKNNKHLISIDLSMNHITKIFIGQLFMCNICQ